MVNIRKALERLWKDRCSIYVKSEKINEVTKRTEFIEVPLYENKPCKLSIKSLSSTKDHGFAAAVTQVTKLFTAVELLIPPGSKISVTKKVDKNFNFTEDELELLKQISKDLTPEAILRMTQGEITINFEKSGEPAIYSNHQEIPLELFKGWS